MVKGKTKSGFAFEVDDEVRDDYDLLKAFSKLQKGEAEQLDEAVELLLGPEQRDKLREHCRGKSGRVLASKIIKEVDNIITVIGQSEDDTKN